MFSNKGTITCYDFWRDEEGLPKIITLCRELDQHLGGGIRPNGIMEFCGGSRTGKTQMCLQLSINVQFPKEVGGAEGKAVYVDTNQDFHPHRIREISQCMEERFQRIFAERFTSDFLLRNISYIYCASYVELMAAVINIRQFLSEDSTIKLIIIDSFSFPLRHIEEVGQRTRISYEILTDLQKMSIDFKVAIVITNELTTRFTADGTKICPALGDIHTHKISQRIILSKKKDTGHHMALLEKSLLSPKVIIPFQIKKGGIRGISVS